MSKVPSDMYFESSIRNEQDNHLLLDVLCERFTYHSRFEWENKLKEGFVTINNEVASIETIAHKNDKVIYHVTNYTEPDVPTNFSILFEDEEFMIVSKPAGIPIHHTGRIFYNTFVSLIRRETKYDTLTPMHRLDRDTGGIMLFAKYSETANRFQKNLDKILLRKCYLAIVEGSFFDGITKCDFPLKEDVNDRIRLRMHYKKDGKECHTLFNKLGQINFENHDYSLVEAELITGRKHQIRSHLYELGFPIVGDRLYNHDGIYYEKLSQGIKLDESDFLALKAKNHMLYAYKVELKLPYWNFSRIFECREFPEEMNQMIMRFSMHSGY